jgi:hypothetical protein
MFGAETDAAREIDAHTRVDGAGGRAQSSTHRGAKAPCTARAASISFSMSGSSILPPPHSQPPVWAERLVINDSRRSP